MALPEGTCNLSTLSVRRVKCVQWSSCKVPAKDSPASPRRIINVTQVHSSFLSLVYTNPTPPAVGFHVSRRFETRLFTGLFYLSTKTPSPFYTTEAVVQCVSIAFDPTRELFTAQASFFLCLNGTNEIISAVLRGCLVRTTVLDVSKIGPQTYLLF